MNHMRIEPGDRVRVDYNDSKPPIWGICIDVPTGKQPYWVIQNTYTDNTSDIVYISGPVVVTLEEKLGERL